VQGDADADLEGGDEALSHAAAARIDGEELDERTDSSEVALLLLLWWWWLWLWLVEIDGGYA